MTASFLSGPALVDVGEAMKELSEVKDSLDMEVKQNFIDPLQNLHDKDLREIQVLPSMQHFNNAKHVYMFRIFVSYVV